METDIGRDTPEPATDQDPVDRRVRRDTIAGRAMIGVGIVAVVAAVLGIFAALRFIDVLTDQAGATLEVTEQAVAAVEDSIGLAQDTMPLVAGSLETVTDGVADASAAIDNIAALLDETAALTGEDIPQSIQAIRDTMPGLIRSAELITGALNALSFLGVEFDPQPTLADSVGAIDAGLATMAGRLQEASVLIEQATGDVSGFAATTDAIAADLVTLQGTLADATALLDTYAATAANASALVAETRAGLVDQSAQLRLLVVLGGIAVAAGQIAPIYLGWRLLDEARPDRAPPGDQESVVLASAGGVQRHVPHRTVSGEDAHTSRADGEPDDDEDDAPQHLSPHQGEDA